MTGFSQWGRLRTLDRVKVGELAEAWINRSVERPAHHWHDEVRHCSELSWLAARTTQVGRAWVVVGRSPG